LKKSETAESDVFSHFQCAPKFVVALDAPTAGITDEEALVAAFAEPTPGGEKPHKSLHQSIIFIV